MVIGTSNGKQYEDMLHMHATPYFEAQDTGEQAPGLDTLDQNIVTPNQMQQNKDVNKDPRNIYNDQGEIVDYDFWKPEKKGEELKPMLPLPNTDLKSMERLPLPKDDSSAPATVQTVSDITTNTGVTITDVDIEKAMGIGMSFSGGGLTTKNVTPMRKAANDNLTKDKQPYNPREPNMIGDDAVDAVIDQSYKDVAKNYLERHDLKADQAKLLRESLDSGWNDISKKKYENNTKRLEEITPKETKPQMSPEEYKAKTERRLEEMKTNGAEIDKLYNKGKLSEIEEARLRKLQKRWETVFDDID